MSGATAHQPVIWDECLLRGWRAGDQDLLPALTQSISPTDSIRIVPLVQGSVEEKLRFIAELESRGAEGFVLKRLDAAAHQLL